MSTKVAVFVGSLRQDSINRKLARAVEKLAPKDLSFEHIDIGGLPLYNQDFDGDYPAACQQLKQAVEAADALLFVTPEYNRSIPGVLNSGGGSGGCAAVRDARIQPFDSRRAEFRRWKRRMRCCS